MAQQSDAKTELAEASSKVYRRIFVPAENIEAWPTNGEKFLPIESREFEAWIAAANAGGNEEASSAIISEAEYSARFEGGRLVAGRGRWVLQVQGEKPGFLHLKDISLVLRDATWKDTPSRPVRLGMWGRTGQSAAEFALDVPESGTLDFEWTVPTSTVRGGLEAPWRLPAAAVSRLTLELPSGMQPRVGGGVALNSTANGDAGSTAQRQWVIACTATKDARLSIVDSRPTSTSAAPEALLRDEIVYTLSQRGIDIQSTWSIEKLDESEIQELSVPLPSGLQISEVLVDDRKVSWRTVDSEDSSRKYATFRLPPNEGNDQHTVIVRASHPIMLARLQRLPKLRPDGILWTSGEAVVHVGKDLELQELQPLLYRITRSDNVRSETNAEASWLLQAYSEQAELDVTVASRLPRPRLRLASSMSLAGADIAGQLQLECTTSGGEVHKLTGKVAPGWIIEAVESTPAEAIGDWFINRRDGGDEIGVQLGRPANSEQALTVTIRGRLPRSEFTNSISASTMQMIDWQDARIDEHVLHFETTEPLAVERIGNLPRFVVDDDDKRSPLLQSTAATDTFFDLLKADANAALRLAAKPAVFDADVLVDVGVANGQLHREYRIAVKPSSGQLAEVVVFVPGTLGEQVRWTLADSTTALSANRLPKDDPRATAISASGELWLARFPATTSDSVEFVAAATSDASKEWHVPLIAIPNANEQSGRIMIRSEETTLPIEREGLTVIPLPADDVVSGRGAKAPLRAAFRYDPSDCLNESNGPSLQLNLADEASLNSLVARRVVTESYYSQDGSASHRVVFHLFSRGDTSFAARLPNANLQSIEVDGVPIKVSPAASTGGGRLISAAVPRGSSEVSLNFETRQAGLAIGDELRPPLPQTNATVLSGEWNLMLPEEFSVSSSESPSWRQRLFGPLGRPEESPPFRPLQAADWANLINSTLGLQQTDEAAVAAPIGWRAYQQGFVAGLPSSVTVSHPPIATAWAACVFTVCVFAGAWLRRRSMRLFAALLTVSALAALLAPIYLLPVPAGVLLGMLASILVPKKTYQPAEIGASTHWHRYSTVGALLLIVLCSFAGRVFGQTRANNDDDAPKPPIESVLMPVGSDGRQAGSKVYISERFARDLIREGNQHSTRGAQWLLKNVECQGEIRQDAAGQDATLSQFEIACELETLTRDAVVVLPLLRDEADWSTAALLDGVPSQIHWSADGNACSIEVPNPGRYTLTITAAPRTRVVRDRHVSSLAIPAHPGAVLRLDRPADLEDVTISEARPIQQSANEGTVTYELHAPGRVTISWPVAGDSRNSAKSRQPIQLEWLEVVDDQLLLTTKYVFEGSSDQDEEVVVAYDPEWELLDKQASYQLTTDSATNRNVLRVVLPAGKSDRQELTFRWRNARPAALGRLLMKPLELLSHKPAQSWRAASADPSLECSFGGASAGSGTVSEFTTLWGEGIEVGPQTAIGNVVASDRWNLSVSPRQTDAEITQVLHLAAKVGKFDVVYQADVTPGTAEQFQYPVAVPEDLSVENVEVVRGGKTSPVRWTRPAKDRVNLLFETEMADAYRVVVHGTLVFDGQSIAIPRVAAVNSTGLSSVQLYRDSSVLLDVSGLPAASDAVNVPLESPPASWSARYVAGYRLSASQLEKIRLTVQPNEVALEGESVTSLVRSTEGWIARYECNLSIAKGTLDALRYRVDPVWNTTPVLESTVPATLSMQADDDESPYIVVRFAEALPPGTSLNLKFEAPIVAASGNVSIPRIRSDLQIQGAHYVRVPTLVDAQPVAWALNSVQPAVLPASFRTFPSQRIDVRTFAVTSDDFQVQLRPRLGSPRPPRVRLADTEICSDPVTGQIVRTVFVIEPQGLRDCTIRLPDGQTLVDVQIADRPALVRHIRGNDWSVVLGPTPLPCRLEVLSRSVDQRADSRQTEIGRVVLLAGTSPIEVEMSLWSVGYPASSSKPSIDVAAEPTADELASLRFDRMLSIAEAATAVAIESPAPDGHNWYRQWASALSRLRDETRNTLADQGSQQAILQVTRPHEEQIAASSRRLDAWIARCDETLPAAEPISSLAGESTPETPVQLTDILPTQRRVYCITDGSLDRLNVEYPSTASGSISPQFVAVLLIICLAVATSVAMKYAVFGDVLHRWPHAVTFLIGIAYWAWLQPSWLGLLIAGASVFFACRSGWPGRAIRTDASTVLRTGHPR